MVVFRGLLCGLVAFFLLALFYLRAPYLHDADSYLHLAVARLYAEEGLVKALPWPRFSVMSQTYGDKELLFHLGMIPFVASGDAATGGRLALAAFNAVVFATISVILWPHVRWLALLIPGWMFLAAPPWNDRLTRLRPEIFALVFLLIAAELTIRRRWVWLGVVSAAFALSYTAFHVLPGLVLIWVLVIRAGGNRWEWKPLTAAIAGTAAGLAVHPHPVDHLRIWLLQNVTFFRLKGDLDVGGEIFAPPWQDVVLVLAGWWIPVGGLLLFALLRRRELARLRELEVYGAAAVVFLGLYLLMGRMAIYFVAFATVAAVVAAARLDWRRGPAFALAAVACAAILPGVAFSMRTEFVADAVAGASATESQLARFGKAVPAGAKIASTWGDAAMFVFAAPQGRYLNLYDPLFMAVSHRRQYDLQRALFAGRIVDIPPLLRTTLDSDYLALQGRRSYPRLLGVLEGDPRWRVVEGGANLLLEAREPVGGRFLLDWVVSGPGVPPMRYPRSGKPLEAFVELPRVAPKRSCRTFKAANPCSGCALRFRAVGAATVRSDTRVVAKMRSPELSLWIDLPGETRSSLAIDLCGDAYAGFFLFAPDAGRTHPAG